MGGEAWMEAGWNRRRLDINRVRVNVREMRRAGNGPGDAFRGLMRKGLTKVLVNISPEAVFLRCRLR